MYNILYKTTLFLILLLTALSLRPISITQELNFDDIEQIDGSYEIHPVQYVKGLDDFLDDIAFRESSGRYHIVNSYGYLGKYQFSPRLLWRLGFRVTQEEFLSSPKLQHKAMVALLDHNKHVMRSVIKRFDGMTFDETVVTRYKCYVETYTITESGILAAAHLIGPYRTRLFLEERIDSKDGYGTQMSEYLYSFSGYNLNL